jgi:hypothetical protein
VKELWLNDMNCFGPQEISESECYDILKALTLKSYTMKKQYCIDCQDMTNWPICLYKQSQDNGDYKYFISVHKIGHCPWGDT